MKKSGTAASGYSQAPVYQEAIWPRLAAPSIFSQLLDTDSVAAPAPSDMSRPDLTDLWVSGMFFCMRTTLQLDDALMRDVKRTALESGRTMTAVIEDALRQALSRREKSKRRRPVKFTTFRGKGLLPGVDLDDSAGLLDRMEQNT